MGLGLFDEVYPVTGGFRMWSATGTAMQALVTAGSVPLRIDGITMINQDTVDRVFEFSLGTGSPSPVIGLITIPAAPLLGPCVPTNVLGSLIFGSQDGIVLPPGGTISIRPTVAIVANQAYVFYRGGNL
jgi:hypothetical protein